MAWKSIRLAILMVALGIVLAGCRACVRESSVWQHTLRTPAQKACPVVRPEYELPPGGPYYERTGPKRATSSNAAIPEKTGGEITVRSK